MIKKLLFSLVLFFLVLEGLLRISGLYKTDDERSSGVYTYRYRQTKPSWYHTWTPNSTITYNNKEFTYINTYNDFGNRELAVDSFMNDTSAHLVVCIGDSFTEGDGTSSDSTWVKRVEANFRNKHYGKLRFYNAGVCGSDVFYNNKLLAGKLMKLHPRVVIECVNYTDIYDIIYRGGAERFNPDTTTSGKVGPYWEALYHRNHIARAGAEILFGYNKYLVKQKDLDKQEWDALSLLKKQVQETAMFCKAANMEYYLVIHPYTREIGPNLLQSKLYKALKDEPYVIDLFKPLQGFYSEHDVRNYTWPVNGHFNGKGYQVMGDAIFEQLEKKGFIVQGNLQANKHSRI